MPLVVPRGRWKHVWLVLGACAGHAACLAGGDTSSSANATGSASGGSGGGVGGFMSSGGSGGACGGCSVDGKSAIDCNGNVTTCGPTELCANSMCMPACEAAETNKSSVGCNYRAVMMDGYAGATGGCFTAFVANTFDSPAILNVTLAGNPIDLSTYAKIPQGTGQSLTYGAYSSSAGLGPGEVAIIFLANTGGVVCPVPAALPSNAAQVTGTGIGQAFSITASVPVVAYQMLPYGGGSAAVTGASLLLPTSAWDSNYIAVNAFAQSMASTNPSLDIVAEEDGTEVTILPKVAITGGPGVVSSAANTPVTYNLNAGQVLQITQMQELTGSPIQANKRIGLWGGHTCLMVPTNMYACDHAEQQIPPVRALGWQYAGVSHATRSAVPENPPWRIIGAVDGTELTFDPPIPGAPPTVNLGDVAQFNTYTPFVVTSQDQDHPFVLVTYMTGEQTVTEFYGDADFVRVTPPDQYLRRYVFFTDPTYPDTNLVVVRRDTGDGFYDVTLDCAGTLTGWEPVGASGQFEFTRIDLIRHNFVPQNGCNNGRHEMTSEGAFGLWVWGWGTPEAPGTISVSYGYPAGENVLPVNDVIVPPLPE